MASAAAQPPTGPARATASLALHLASPVDAQAILAALAPEMTDGPGGSRIELRQAGATLHAELTANTASHLRAALTSLLRLAAVAEAGTAKNPASRGA
jgi:tRNA threonylcarbamoyladenosine modification (KEOPS) complex  Pcc1 subunit